MCFPRKKNHFEKQISLFVGFVYICADCNPDSNSFIQPYTVALFRLNGVRECCTRYDIYKRADMYR